jgi:hypothetical protein
MAISNIESGIWTSSTSGLLRKVSYGAAATHEPETGGRSIRAANGEKKDGKVMIHRLVKASSGKYVFAL